MVSGAALSASTLSTSPADSSLASARIAAATTAPRMSSGRARTRSAICAAASMRSADAPEKCLPTTWLIPSESCARSTLPAELPSSAPVLRAPSTSSRIVATPRAVAASPESTSRCPSADNVWPARIARSRSSQSVATGESAVMSSVTRICEKSTSSTATCVTPAAASWLESGGPSERPASSEIERSSDSSSAGVTPASKRRRATSRR
jgi:hypothetical protein